MAAYAVAPTLILQVGPDSFDLLSPGLKIDYAVEGISHRRFRVLDLDRVALDLRYLFLSLRDPWPSDGDILTFVARHSKCRVDIVEESLLLTASANGVNIVDQAFLDGLKAQAAEVVARL